MSESASQVCRFLTLVPTIPQQTKVLQGEVERLHALLTDVVRGQRGGGQGTMVIHTGRSSWAVYVYPVVGVGLVYVYCR